jgi:hypothetical protein
MGMSRTAARKVLVALAGGALLAGVTASSASAQLPSTTDPRVGLAAGLENPGVASRGIEHLATVPKPPGWFNPNNPGDFAFPNSDLAFQGNLAFMGGFNGVQIFDISDPAHPRLRTAVVCPGGQGDVSVYQNLLFMSVEETRARTNCSLDPQMPQFRGVRIFDISNLDDVRQVGQVQTCRGSHTHTLVEGKDSPDTVYIYVQGTNTSAIRSNAELAGCNGPLANDTPDAANPSQWRIEVIRVPLAAPQNAAIVSEPRLFRNETTGAVNGLQNTPQTLQHPSGINWQPVPDTNSCHDITVYEALDLAAGSCEGNGLLIDISDPANPRRIDAVADPIFAYWHGATFSNDGTKVFFTDEWGGGTNARCRATDQLSWGANAIYEIVDRKLVFRSYYKMPAAQTNQENCVSHLPSLVPVLGRDIFIQAWYQGGASLVDFTNPSQPKEIGFFDRGPIDAQNLVLGGYWSTYWYNGAFYGSEIARGFDSFRLTPTSDLSAYEIGTAVSANKQVRFNAQTQQPLAWPTASVGGNVPATLSLTMGPAAQFGALTPGVGQTYETSTTADVISTAGDATLSVADPSAQNTGHLVNGSFFLPQPLQARARNAANQNTAYNNVGSSASPLNLLTWNAPISNDALSLEFSQRVNANDALRTGTYSKTLTFTLSTTQP